MRGLALLADFEYVFPVHTTLHDERRLGLHIDIACNNTVTVTVHGYMYDRAQWQTVVDADDLTNIARIELDVGANRI